MTPLAGCRVLDLGIITAGAATSTILADLGADVIKVESPSYRDPFRRWGGGPADGESPFFRATNRNKRCLSLNLGSEAGREAFLRLVERSDVVVENFRRGVLTKLGIDYPALSARNPHVVLASISSQGDTGPDAGRISFGSTLEAVGGMAMLAGYAHGPAMVSGRELNYPDQVVAIFASGMIVTAWRSARAGGPGVHLDLSQRELTSFLIGDVFVAGPSASGRVGNAQYPYLFQDCLRAADGVWFAVSIEAEDAAATQRLLNEESPGIAGDDLASSLAEWAARRPVALCVEQLNAAGIAAAVANDGASVLREHRWSSALVEDETGFPFKGLPFSFADGPPEIDLEVHPLGADTAHVLRTIAGYSEAEVRELIRSGVAEGPDRE